MNEATVLWAEEVVEAFKVLHPESAEDLNCLALWVLACLFSNKDSETCVVVEQLMRSRRAMGPAVAVVMGEGIQ